MLQPKTPITVFGVHKGTVIAPGKVKLVERLRGWYGNIPICLESAAEIERLTAELRTSRYWRQQEVNDLIAERDALKADAENT